MAGRAARGSAVGWVSSADRWAQIGGVDGWIEKPGSKQQEMGAKDSGSGPLLCLLTAQQGAAWTARHPPRLQPT